MTPSSRPNAPQPSPGAGGTAVDLCWHGGPSYSLRLAGLVILVDPSFSRPGDYPPWFDSTCANPHAPSVREYLVSHQPDYLFITHGHFDHFDLRTMERLAAALDFPVVGSPEVLRTCRDVLGLPAERLLPCPTLGDGWLELRPGGRATGETEEAAGCATPPVRVAALPAPHWFTGAEGDAVAARFAGRPDRFGAMPCGGPMLGFVFQLPDGAQGSIRVWVSGDTEPAGFPRVGAAGPFDVAVVCCGGSLRNPATKQLAGPYLDEATLARAVGEHIRPRVLVPAHYDHPVFQTPFDPAQLAAELDSHPDPPRLVIPPYNTWARLLD